jgi:arsenical pump membrane protein
VLSQRILTAAAGAWPPFVLVAGLLSIGAVAAADGLFEAIGARLAQAPLRPRALLVLLLGLVAAVTAVLNLDTAVVFLTPVLVHAGRSRRLDERPFLYGSVFMANSASLLLPGSNLTNLLLLERNPEGGVPFARQMFPAWLTACALTAVFLTLAYPLQEEGRRRRGAPPLRFGLGAAATFAAAALVLALRNAALPVLALGLAASAWRRVRPRLDIRALGLLFAVTVCLGTLAEAWTGPQHLLETQGRLATAAIAAIGSLALNNLPAAVLFSAHAPPHPHALLLGLDLGPNLAVTGSLSAVLWLQAARAVGADASIRTYTRLGALLVPLTLAGALVAS